MHMLAFTRSQEMRCYNGSMIEAMNIATAGMRVSAQQFAKSAENVVKATMPDSTEDLTKAIVDSNISSYTFKANAAVAKTAGKMMGSLINTLA
jgi:flagellar hook protein FlgE